MRRGTFIDVVSDYSKNSFSSGSGHRVSVIRFTDVTSDESVEKVKSVFDEMVH